MDLSIFKKKDEDASPNYWSLVIGESWIQAGIWQVINSQVHLIAQGNVTSWEEGNEESLVSAADGSLSSAASSVTSDIEEPNKVVFGLPASWVQEGDIEKVRLNLLKKLTDELELSPSGFVVVPEAIAHLLKAKEGAPLNGILLGISEEFVEVSLVQNGKIIGNQEVARSVSLGTDLSEGLSKIPSIAQYPTRILLYDHKAGSLDDARQNLLQTDWEKEVNIRFLHTPKVEVLHENTAVVAVSLAGGAEVGQAKSIVVTVGPEKEVVESLPISNNTSLPQEEIEESETTNMLEDIGFLEDEDVAQQSNLNNANIEGDVEDLDFSQHDNIRVPDNAVVPQPEPFPLSGRNVKRGFKLPGFRLPSIRFPFAGAGMLGIGIVGGIIFLLFAGLAFWYLPKADVAIFVSPKKIEKTFVFTVDPNLTVVDQANNIIGGTTKEVSVSGEKTASTTGTKTIGERAKGNVTITNGGGSRLLKSGTILSGPNNLKFALKDDVTVASASSVAKPSETQAAVIAGDIGAEYNLAQGGEFVVGNFSKLDMIAQNDEALGGGSSREIAAVSDKDQANVLQDLTQELISRGIDETKTSLPPTELLVPDSASFVVQDKTYSSKIGEEASTLKVSLKGTVKLLVLPKDSLQSLAIDKISGEVPAGFSLKAEQLTFEFKTVAAKKEDTSKTTKKTTTVDASQTQITNQKPQLETKVVANLLPQINPDEIKKSIVGKKPADAKEFLATIPGFVRAEVSFKLKLPAAFQTIPRLTKNINIEIEAEK